jgi:hypothetical protein
VSARARLHGVPNTKDAKPLAQSSPWSYLDDAYYQRAVEQIEQRIANPHFFVFSDYADPDWLRANVRTRHPIDLIAHNGADKDYEDFWLMGQCRHFIIANSTFSWWRRGSDGTRRRSWSRPRTRSGA